MPEQKIKSAAEAVLAKGILIFGEPILRKKAKPVKKMGEEERQILEAMAKLMYDAQGCGLAATQVGIDRQLFVVDVGGGPLKLANPKILKKEGFDVIEEGCLSLPGVLVKVKRPRKIWIECLDCDNKKVRFEAQDILSRALQHEIDHLRGKLIIDYAGLRQKLLLKRRLKKLARGRAHG
jgi:peptide deformylase